MKKRAQELQKQYIANQKQKETPIINYTHWERAEHMSWCNKNGIIIYPATIDNYKLRLVVETNGVGKIGEHVYKNWAAKMSKDDVRWADMIRKLYTFYFLKLGGVSCRNVELELEIYLVELKK